MTQKFNFFLPIPELSMFVHKSGKRPFHARAACSNTWGAKTNFGFCTKNRNDSDFFLPRVARPTVRICLNHESWVQISHNMVVSFSTGV